MVRKWCLLVLFAPAQAVHPPTFGRSAFPSMHTEVAVAVSEKAEAEVSMNSSLHGALGAVSNALMDTALDTEMLLVTAGGGGGGGGASNLAAYCAGETPPPKEGQKVEADWKNYGQHYPGEVRDVNKDGTYDIHYDDGFVEKRVKDKNVRPEDGKEVKAPPKDDPACEIVDALEKIKAQIKKSFADISAWLASQRAKRAGQSTEKVVPPPRAEVAAAPGPAPAPEPVVKSDDPAKNTELADLKAELAAADEEVRQLEEDVASNDATIRSALGADKDRGNGAKTIDDLIEEYKSLIARRKEWIVFLKDKKAKQEQQLTGLGFSSVTLGDIDQSVQDILSDLAGVTQIRDKLKKQDKLDPELKSAIQGILKQSGKLNDKVTALVNADKAAKEKKRLAAEKRKADKKAGKEAKEEEEDEEAADDDVLKAAEDVEKELQEVDAGAKKLDGGVHPHGDKWWRYRYEHSFVEAILMLVIVFFIILWERLYHWMRAEAYKRSEFDAYSWMTHSTMHISWLEYFSGELMVCLLVFLTVWLVGKLGMFDYLVLYMPEDKSMHLPNKGSEYEHLAIDVCVVLFWAIVFYYILSLSIVHAATHKLSEWAEMDKDEGEATGTAQRFTMIGGTASEYDAIKTYFTAHVHSRPHLQQEIWGDTEQAQNEDFPLWSYMRAVIREGTEPFFAFGLVPWCMIIVTFVIFMFLHYFMHMGYIRIMSFFLGLFVFQMLAVIWFISGINKKLNDPDNATKLPADSIHNKYNTEKMIVISCFYNVFILCYGIARVVCQPWMWELHFWVVLNLAIFAVILAIVFCVFIAPLFPVFLVAMSLPPYLDPENIAVMKTVISHAGSAGDISDRRSYINRVKGL